MRMNRSFNAKAGLIARARAWLTHTQAAPLPQMSQSTRIVPAAAVAATLFVVFLTELWDLLESPEIRLPYPIIPWDDLEALLYDQDVSALLCALPAGSFCQLQRPRPYQEFRFSVSKDLKAPIHIASWLIVLSIITATWLILPSIAVVTGNRQRYVVFASETTW
jgi:hypothetical protein